MSTTSDFMIVRPMTVTTSMLVDTNLPENDYQVYDPLEAYDKGERCIVIDDGGSPEVFYHNVYESVIDGTGTNTGNFPPLEVQGDRNNPPTKWLLVGKTNRWKPFDGILSDVAVADDLITYTINATQRINSISALNVRCRTITIQVFTASMVEVFNQTYRMIQNSGASSFYSWFYQQIQLLSDLVEFNLPPIFGATLVISFESLGETVSVGEIVVGFAESAGVTLKGANFSITDFSVKQRDPDFGQFTILERNFSKETEVTVMVDNGNVDRLSALLASRRATATLYVASSKYSSSYIYGFYRDFDIVVSYDTKSLMNIQLEGLT